MKPGSCGPGALGIYPVIYDEDRNEIPRGSGKAGNICIRNPWPGIMQTVWGQPERFLDVYYRKYNTEPGQQGLARLAVLLPATARSRPRTATSGSWAGSTTSSTSPATASAPRSWSRRR